MLIGRPANDQHIFEDSDLIAPDADRKHCAPASVASTPLVAIVNDHAGSTPMVTNDRHDIFVRAYRLGLGVAATAAEMMASGAEEDGQPKGADALRALATVLRMMEGEITPPAP